MMIERLSIAGGANLRVSVQAAMEASYRNTLTCLAMDAEGFLPN